MRSLTLPTFCLLALFATASADDMPTTTPACTLSPAELQQRRHELLPGLFKRADHITDLPDGLRLHFAAREGLLTELARIIEAEQTCCNFLRFAITVEPAGGAVTFEVTGPTGTREMLRGL